MFFFWELNRNLRFIKSKSLVRTSYPSNFLKFCLLFFTVFCFSCFPLWLPCSTLSFSRVWTVCVLYDPFCLPFLRYGSLDWALLSFPLTCFWPPIFLFFRFFVRAFPHDPFTSSPIYSYVSRGQCTPWGSKHEPQLNTWQGNLGGPRYLPSLVHSDCGAYRLHICRSSIDSIKAPSGLMHTATRTMPYVHQ